MSRLTVPELPPGNLQILMKALDDLHRRAGRPSTRQIADGLTFTHDTVHRLFTKTLGQRPRWRVLSEVVGRLAAEVPGGDADAELARFHDLWVRADEQPFSADDLPELVQRFRAAEESELRDGEKGSDDDEDAEGDEDRLSADDEESMTELLNPLQRSVETAKAASGRTDPTVEVPRGEEQRLEDSRTFAPRRLASSLPTAPATGVVGREGNLATLARLVDEAGERPVSLYGIAGIGKTTLVAEFVRQQARQFPDGFLFTALGPTPQVRPLLETWARRLRVDLTHAATVDECSAELQTVLADRRVLIVIDDVWNAESVPPFRVGGSAARTLLTAREPNVAMKVSTRAGSHSVDVLAADDAVRLLTVLAPELVGTDPEAAHRLCRQMQFHPLGITLAGRLLDAESAVPARMRRLLAELLERAGARLALLQSEPRIGVPEGEPVTLRAILALSVDRLDPLDRERFAMCAVLGGDPVVWTVEEAAVVWSCPVPDAEGTIARLIQRALVQRRGSGYWMHALLRDYAEVLLVEEYALDG